MDNWSVVGVDKILTLDEHDEYDDTFEADTDLHEQVIKLGELNELVYQDFVLSINTKTLVEKVLFELEEMQNV